jgi:cobalt-precorrin-5B (C1)-methyltransferase
VRWGWGITTGTCAAAAAKAAAIVLGGGPAPSEVELRLPGDLPLCVPILGQGSGVRGQGSGDGRVRVPILFARRSGAGAATASVRKDAGQDADVTHGMEVRVTVAWDAADGVTLAAGEGVGTVTKPGLQVPPGQPAINPVPREMIAAALREVTARGVRAQIAIPGGRQTAQKTFNPRLGITGGLSILGTTGFVRPHCTRALREALRCALRVAAACGVKAPVLAPGNIGAKAARQHFALREEQVIEAGNAWGFLLDEALATPSPLPLGEGSSAFRALLLVGHPGKLAKLAAGQWDTHSSRSAAATEYLGGLGAEVLGQPAPDMPTVEGMLKALSAGERESLAAELARRVRQAVARRIHDRAGVAVLLVDMAGRRLGADGDFSPWQ